MQARFIHRARGSAHVDFYAPVLGFGYAFGSRHQRLALAAAGHLDVIARDAALDQIVSHALRSLAREVVVELGVAHRVGVADDENIRVRPGRNFGKYAFDLTIGIRREFGLQQEYGGASRQRRRDKKKFTLNAIGHESDWSYLAGTVDMRTGIGLMQNDCLAAIGPDDDATDLAVRLWQQDDQVVARRSVRRAQSGGFDRLLGLTPASRARWGANCAQPATMAATVADMRTTRFNWRWVRPL